MKFKPHHFHKKKKLLVSICNELNTKEGFKDFLKRIEKHGVHIDRR